VGSSDPNGTPGKADSQVPSPDAKVDLGVSPRDTAPLPRRTASSDPGATDNGPQYGHPRMYVRGTMNGWGATPMNLVGDGYHERLGRHPHEPRWRRVP